jgi:hypothetical protein
LVLVVAAACSVIQPRPERANETHARIWDRNDALDGPSYAIYPTQHIPLRFDHARHLAIPGLGCTPCHARATTSRDAADRLVPPESACTPCHTIDRRDPFRTARPAARCDACHVGFDPAMPTRIARVQFPASNLIFSHSAHLARGQSCASCHGTMRQVGLATRLELPVMQQCFSCHRAGGTAEAACTECHLTRPDGVMRTAFAEGLLNPPTWMNGLHHDADFWVTHRFVAADDGSRCATCHRESDCTDCHDGRVRDRRLHPNDYVMLHATEARQSAERCQSCHRTASFCSDCHLRSGVAESSAVESRALGRFHPPPDVWSGRVVTPQHHAAEARRSLTACVSCHTERDCTTCHGSTSMGGGGLDPHPPGWAARCGYLLRTAPRGCEQCHSDLATLASQCR